MAFKCSMFWRLDDWGWSENYYSNDSDASAVGVAFGTLIDARAALLCTDVQFIGGRISDVDPAKDTWDFASAVTAGTYPGDVESYDPVYCRVMKGGDNAGHWTVRFLHALPESVITPERTFLDDGVWSIAMSTYRGVVAGAGTTWALRHSNGATPPAYTYPSILFIREKPRLRNRKLGRPFGLPVGRQLIG